MLIKSFKNLINSSIIEFERRQRRFTVHRVRQGFIKRFFEAVFFSIDDPSFSIVISLSQFRSDNLNH